MIRKRPSGRYQVQIDNGFDRTGKRLRIAGGTYRTKAEAQKAERAMLQGRDRGFELATSDVTVVGLIELYIVECENLDEAIEWAAKIPTACEGHDGCIEIRPMRWQPTASRPTTSPESAVR